MNIDLKKVIEQLSPRFFTKYPSFLTTGALKLLERIIHLQKIQAFFEQYGDRVNWEFIEAVFEYLDFRCLVSDEDRKKIPAKGNVICVANHPLGILDGLSLLKTIGTVRQDVKIVVSDLIAPVENLKALFLFYDLYSRTMQKKNIEKIKDSLLREEAIIFFPAGSVAKLTARGIRESTWRNGPVLFARKLGVPVLPMYVNAENSLLYYLITLINPHFATLFLPHEMFKKRSHNITLKIGEVIPKEVFERRDIDILTQTESLKNHVLEIG
jgi:putative hemolysin